LSQEYKYLNTLHKGDDDDEDDDNNNNNNNNNNKLGFYVAHIFVNLSACVLFLQGLTNL